LEGKTESQIAKKLGFESIADYESWAATNNVGLSSASTESVYEKWKAAGKRLFGTKRSFMTAPIEYYQMPGSRKRHPMATRSPKAPVESKKPKTAPKKSKVIEGVFIKNGDTWKISFDGVELPPIKHLKGLELIRLLLENQTKEFTPAELNLQVEGHPATIDSETDLVESDGLSVKAGLGNAGEAIDQQTITGIKQSLENIACKIKQATDSENFEKVEKLEDEREKLQGYLSRNVDLRGRPRLESASDENARTNLTKRVRQAIEHLKKYNLGLAAHLDAAVNTGTIFYYRSPQRTHWQT
jgi:hypothetical protein